MDRFQDLWDEHVQFGTSRSHKKLLGKKRTRESDPSVPSSSSSNENRGDSTMSGISKPKSSKKQRHQAATTMAAGARNGSSSEAAAAARIVDRETSAETSRRASDAVQMANKGRFAGTLATRLLAGGTGDQ